MYRNLIQLAPKTFEQEWFYAVESFRRGNFEDALRRFGTLAEKGVPEAYTELGNLCELGYGLSAPDLDQARTWYEKAIAAIDCPNAHLGLSRVLLQSEGEGNLGRAVRHATIAARNGNPLALWLRVQATWKTICIATRDRSDPRLWAVVKNRVKIARRLG